MPNLLVRDVPEHVAESLKRRAATNRRSLQQELLEILEQATQPGPMTSAGTAAAIRESLAQAGVFFQDSTSLIRADGER